MGPPPQAPAIPLGVEITKPGGKVSLNPMPLSAVAEFALLMVKLSEVEAFNGMLGAPNALLRMGGAITVIEAFEVFPVPACVDVAVTLLFLIPAVAPVTSREIVQEELTANVPAARLMDEAPAAAVMVPVQVVTTFGGVPTTKPAGRLSVNVTPVRARLALGLAIVKLSDVEPCSGMDAAPKVLEMVCEVAVPVPLRARVCGVLAASSDTLKVATFAPKLAGENITLMVQVPALATLAPQLEV
jgi:hypothetical protein